MKINPAEIVLDFGKYKGHEAGKVAQTDKQYMRWLRREAPGLELTHPELWNWLVDGCPQVAHTRQAVFEDFGEFEEDDFDEFEADFEADRTPSSDNPVWASILDADRQEDLRTEYLDELNRQKGAVEKYIEHHQAILKQIEEAIANVSSQA